MCCVNQQICQAFESKNSPHLPEFVIHLVYDSRCIVRTES